ncbi:MAG: nuclear transport factor 2 family protein [Lutibacter sp.]
MKKFILLLMILASCNVFAQIKKNGTIYIKHPAINIVENMIHAMVKGDTTKVSSYLSDNFKAFYGSNTDKMNLGTDKNSFLKQVNNWHQQINYFTVKRTNGAYPDALEYKDGENDNVIWVQTWNHFKGVHKKTGVKIDMPFHRLFVVDKQNKITVMISYYNAEIGTEIQNSFNNRTNGTIYNHHPYINTVRKMMHAFEFNDLELAYSFFVKQVRFRDVTTPIGKFRTLDEEKKNNEEFFKKYEVVSIDVVGYPDFLDYELGHAQVVQSWWNIGLVRKSDKKTLVVPVMLIDYFNSEGKISREMSYFNPKLLEE